ncbi:MAG: isoleucine--tRNA ligase, partial [Ilumatobacteraceae bacterium]
DYAVMEEKGVRYILAEARLGAYERELADAAHVATIKGSELVGRHYTPLFPFFSDTPNAFQVLAGAFVTTEDGTGVVHMAPGFGEDDQNACNAVGIPTICPMDEHGRFTADVPTWVGMHVFDTNTEIVKELKARGAVVRHDTYQHSYPHCWRCAEPLVYRAISSWFVEVTAFRERMSELNQQIHWVPEHVKEGSFGKWLANARDWSISRNRFWGSPIPVWKSDDPNYPRVDVYGSIADLERDFGVQIDDLHRPYVDVLVRPNPDDPTGRSTMRRVAQVLDCWFESGSMPFAQVHYPFENADWFESHYPGDFIVEYMAQTRGWFYTLHVLATALFDRPAFRNCVSHGVVLGDDGQKMSKSLDNYPDPMMVFDTYGADAMRWHLLSSTILRGGDLSVTENGIRESVRHVVLPMWNTYSFFTMYVNAAGYTAQRRVESTDPLDQYILGKLHALVIEVTSAMDAYDLFAACGTVRTFLDALTNWYVRRSRERFWAGDHEALDVLWTVLTTFCQVAAPLLPLTTEAVYRGLVGVDSSVHLTDWPAGDGFVESASLVTAMDRVRDVCSAASAVRKATGRRVRQPLSKLTIAARDAESLEPFREIIADEINVKEVVLSTDLDSVGRFELTVVPSVLGPRVGRDVQKVIAAVKQGSWTQDDVTGVVTAGGVELADGEYSLRLVAADPSRAATLPANTGVVVLDIDLTTELEAEGVARDLVRLVQQARRDAGLHVSDRIALRLGLPDSIRDQVAPFSALITEPTLAVSLSFGQG